MPLLVYTECTHCDWPEWPPKHANTGVSKKYTSYVIAMTVLKKVHDCDDHNDRDDRGDHDDRDVQTG